jgi:glutamyl-tRNA synthetase
LEMHMTVRTRFAPSPTGYLHIGGVRTALFNWLLAKQAGGQFILRIDDTDSQRNVQEALQPILDGFRWLGMHWDEGPDVGGPHGPYFQSQRGEHYKAAARQLLESGHAYRDFARPEELEQQRDAAKSAGKTFVYDRRWMAETDAQAEAFLAEGRTLAVRLKMPREGKCKFHDEIRGDVEFQWAEEQDHVIQRADGSCLYNLASVVDDDAFKITHVVRSIEHLSNTPRQIFIAQSLGYPLPVYAHLPYVAEPGGTAKLSKRKLDAYLRNKDFASLYEQGQKIAQRTGLCTTKDAFNPVVVDFYEAIGFLPDAILNYLLLLGWSLDDSTEDFTREQMIQHFTLGRVNKAGASLGPQKLISFQAKWMHKLSVEERTEMVLPFLARADLIEEPVSEQQRSYVTRIVRAADDRIKIAGDILEFDDFFTADDSLKYDAAAFTKRLTDDPIAVELLRKFRQRIASVEIFDEPNLESCLKQFVEAEGIKFNQIIHALRLSVTGKAVGFGMFDSMAILGKGRVLARVDKTLELVAQPS